MSWLAPARPPKPRVLCVDDDVNVVLTVQRILGGRFDVTAVVGGRAGLDAVRAATTPFAAVVSDIRMPDLHGIALLQCIREIAPDTVRIVLTAYPDRETALAAIEMGGVFSILVKPVNADRLLATVTAAVEQFRAPGASDASDSSDRSE